MNNRNFENEIQTAGDMILKINQNNALLLKTPSTFTVTQTYDQINVNKIIYTPPSNKNINLCGSVVGINVINIGISSTMSDNHVILGNNSGNNNSISQNNVYIGHGISHLSSNPHSNSCALGNNSVISSSNTVFLGTSTQQVQLYNPIITNPPVFDYLTYPLLNSSQAGFQKTFNSTGIFSNVFDVFQNMSTIIMTHGLYNISYSVSILPVTISTTIDKFMSIISIGDNLPTQLQVQSNCVDVRVDTKNQTKSINYNYGNSIVFNNTSGAKTFILNMLFYSSEMILPLAPINYTYTVSVTTTRIW